ncbi:DUF2157 domain-containing protein [Flagellimonas sp. S3867]|uniref:DUF2157 domain-containing protein n=1 Tax=Flagellimonas sp. S3867 TaxID=2768063 RepID=UPI0016887A4A|nr:DUF2157 domain-containing protein [Flagellimonas sp. S3867]
MAKITREDIQIIHKYSNWSEKSVAKALKENVYNDSTAWLRFLKLFLLGLGASFITFGILFFFAYNWEDLHKFVKIGLIEGLVVAITLVVLFSRLSGFTKNILLTAASILVGVLLAVFGQIYQTGANAYDLFLGWTLLITLWVIVSNFAPMWLLYIILINTTFILYTGQVAHDWSAGFIFTLFFSINIITVLIFVLESTFNFKIHSPKWLQNLLLLSVVSIGTFGVISGIFDGPHSSFIILYLLVLLFFGLGIWYGLKREQIIYISLIPFGAIIIISALLIELSDGAAMFLVVGLFIVISVSLLIMALLKLQRKWKR